MTSTLRVCLSLGRVKRIEEGLGNFFLGLARALIAESLQPSPHPRIEWHVHARTHLHGCLGDNVTYHTATRLHRLATPLSAKFDVWHVLHQLNTLRPAWRSRRVLLTVHDLNFLYDADQSRCKHQLMKVSAIAKRADEIVCISAHTSRDVAKHLAPSAPVSVVANGVDDLSKSERTPIDGLAGMPFFFHLSRMTANKNPQCLLDTAKIWPEKYFVFAGPPTDDAQRLARENAGLSNVRFVGELTDAQKSWAYANCEAFLFPSLAEGFGLPPLEAMQLGAPVFIANRTSLPEICPFEIAHLDELDAVSIKTIISVNLTKQMAKDEVAKRIAHANSFSWQRCARGYLDVYRRLAAQS